MDEEEIKNELRYILIQHGVTLGYGGNEDLIEEILKIFLEKS